MIQVPVCFASTLSNPVSSHQQTSIVGTTLLMLTGISILTSRTTDNVYPTLLACNAPARFLTAESLIFNGPAFREWPCNQGAIRKNLDCHRNVTLIAANAGKL